MRIDRRLAAAGAGLSAAALAVLLTATPAVAAPATYTPTTDPVKAAAGWLATQFVDGTHLPAPDGDHFDQKYGSVYYPNYGVNADVVFGLAAAKAGAAKIDVALDYLARNVDAYGDITNSDGYGPYDGAVAKTALAAIVGGADPTDFGRHNLMRTLATDECKPGATTCTPGSAENIYSSFSESFVILAQARTGGAYAPTPQALNYLVSLQCANGGFTEGTTTCGTGAADLDATSYAIMALAAAGGHASEIGRAVSWLAGQQHAGGYWVNQGAPNANSTGLAAAALNSQGNDVGAAQRWLRSQQVAAGHVGAGAVKYRGKVIATTKAATSPSVLATAQALTGLAPDGSLATVSAHGADRALPLFAPSASVTGGAVRGGRQQTATGIGFVAGEKVGVSVHSTPIAVATATADALGTVRATYTVPATLAAGTHSVVLTGLSSGLSVQRSITVTAAPAGGSSTASAPVGTVTTPSAPLAATGQDRAAVSRLALVGALAVAVGLLITLAGRRQVPAPARHRRR